ncbi:MAG TPA: T9SS type A sorting domain-containing protein [Arachidicoccus sp.]
MKKIALVLGVFVSTFFAANAQCTIEPDSIPSGQLSNPDTLPCVVQGEAYDQVVQFKIPSSADPSQFGFPSFPGLTITIDSVVITGTSGMPQGITATWNPASGVFYGGSNGCFHVSGTTNDPAGSYPVTLEGTATVTVASPFYNGDTTVPLALLSQAGGGNSPFNLSLDVIEEGQPCRPPVSGISTLNNFNAIINVFPNPTKNVLNVNINTVDRINGTITIFDMLGRAVYTEKVDYLGLVNKQINVANFGTGIYSLQITNNKNAYKTKFIVE